ncbi:MAG: acetate--CoA ligase [Spongiibacteraceae bacterium]|nr:acetate--CoA ligase [Spongiibacteraceae bacterium]
MNKEVTYPVMQNYKERALINDEQYQQLYQQSINEPDTFWGEQAKRIDWIKPFSLVKDVSFAKDDLYIHWFPDGTLNASVNCIDRHLADKAEQVAISWEPDREGAATRTYTYLQLHRAVCQLANALKSLNVTKGDVVTVYMPMVPEAIITLLACARIGAIHSVVFAGFSPEALAGRIEDGRSNIVITADEGLRGGKTIPLKNNVDAAIALCHTAHVDKVIVLKHTEATISWIDGRDHCYHNLTRAQPAHCDATELSAEDSLFILYTSGSTGKPKGVLHTIGGYMVYASLTHQYVFDYQNNETYWCMADIGWITGHTYCVYGPLSNGASIVMYEGVPHYPDAGRMARIIDKYQIKTVYTSPTVIRSLMAQGDSSVANTSLDSVRILATVGEPINPEAWRWFYEKFGHNTCPVIDTWWQTETGGIMITPLPGATTLKPGSATRPFFGIQPALLDNDGNVIEGEGNGNLVIKDSWPGQMRTLFGDHQRFIDTYFSTFAGYYFTSDGARRDADGYYWITGRVDDVLNVSGHRLGTAEIESALVAHPAVAEAAVVGFPHKIKGQGIYIYVTLNRDQQPSSAMRSELKHWLRKEIGPIVTPDIIQWAQDLPKTRSGKIMRRILRKIAANEYDSLGDISTLADPTVVEHLITNHQCIMQTRE